jgi:hypothetical protein
MPAAAAPSRLRFLRNCDRRNGKRRDCRDSCERFLQDSHHKVLA